MDKEKVKEIFGEYWDGIKDKSWWNLSNKEFENIAYKQVAEEITQSREDTIDEVIIDAYDYMKLKENEKKACTKSFTIALPLAIIAAIIIIYVLFT